MGNTRKISKKQNRSKGCAAPWSDLNHHLLYLVLMKLEVFDFCAFSEVCKPWRSLALSNKTKFMASRPPMAISISEPANEKEYWLEDSEGRKTKMPLPQSDGRTCVGLTCGYLVLLGSTRDFWLVNPITRHGLYFPHIPYGSFVGREGVRAILVFSPSISAWVFLVLCRYSCRIWFSIVGKIERNQVFPAFFIHDLHYFKGKIYAIDAGLCVYELGLDPEPKMTLVVTKNYAELKHPIMTRLFVEFICSGENLYAIECLSKNEYEVHELDFSKMKWVSPDEKRMEEDAFFVSDVNHSAVIKRELLLDSWLRNKKHGYTSGKRMFFTADMWYFSQDCLKFDPKT